MTNETQPLEGWISKEVYQANLREVVEKPNLKTLGDFLKKMSGEFKKADQALKSNCSLIQFDIADEYTLTIGTHHASDETEDINSKILEKAAQLLEEKDLKDPEWRKSFDQGNDWNDFIIPAVELVSGLGDRECGDEAGYSFFKTILGYQ